MTGSLMGWLRRRKQPSQPMPVNFSRSPSKNYAQIQDQIASAVFRHLPSEAVTATQREYREGAVNLSLFIRDPVEVLLSHGLADKRYFWRRNEDGEGRMLNGFQHVMVPGRWMKDRLLETSDIELPPERIHIVGWPRLDLLIEQQQAYDRQDIPRGERRPRVLWAPTHDYRRRGPQNESTSSYPEFEPFLPVLEERFDVQVSLHPRNREDKQPTSDQLLWADYVISDFGTMVYEAWALGKPVLFPYWIMGERIVRYLGRSAEGAIFERRIGLHADSMDELVGMLDDGPRIEPDVDGFMAAYLEPSLFGRSGQRAAQVLDDLRRGREVSPLVPEGFRPPGGASA
jgi:hypothetical protein